MRNHTCLLDHHQRSHYDTITIGPEGMINWALQLNNSQSVKIVRQSRGEVQLATFSQLTQPRPKPICDRSGKPDSTEDVFVVKGETSRSHEIDEKRLHEELGFFRLIRENLIICLKTPVLSKLTMDQGHLMSVTAQVHTQ